ncbi:MAG: hypothetical protein HIU82_16905, partial [Proteobacteria bacterium]|nr:hypothetical protein [Pseudomonadota bacterium]
MDASEFDRALIASAFTLAGEQGWARFSVAEAARRAGLPLDRARGRFPGRRAVLAGFGRMADQAALGELATAVATAGPSFTAMPATGMPATGMPATGMPATGMPTPGMA